MPERRWLCLAWTMVAGCGQQYADPIREQPAATTCPASQVIELAGASYASAVRPIQDDFSIEAWLKTASSPMGDHFSDGTAIVFSDVEMVQVNDFAAGLLNDKFMLWVGGPDTAAASTSSVTTDEWVHVAATRRRQDGVILVYVAGVLEGSAAGNHEALADAATINIGGRANRNYFRGLMSELRLWSEVRTSDQIVDNMQRRLNGDEAGLVGYYRFDEGAGSTAHDSSPGANDAALAGPVSWTEAEVPLCGP